MGELEGRGRTASALREDKRTPMQETPIPFAAMLVAALSLPCAAAPGEGAKSESLATARCDKEVRDYLGILEFIRTSAGSQIGGQVAAGYVDEKTVRAVQQKQGSCAAAQLIRAKTSARGS
jgi:hypothetical protein